MSLLGSRLPSVLVLALAGCAGLGAPPKGSLDTPSDSEQSQMAAIGRKVPGLIVEDWTQ